MDTRRKKLHDACREMLQQRVASAREEIRLLQLAANEETKSSAGDKYETGRAMAQLEIEKLNALLADSQRVLQALEAIEPDRRTDAVQPGSVAITSQGNFYVAVSAGKIVIGNDAFMAISPASPIGKLLTGRKAGDTVLFNGRSYRIDVVE